VGFDWKRYEGEEVSVLLNKHPLAEAIIALIPDFEAQTGIKVVYEVLAETEYFEKQRLEFASGQGLYDVTMTGPGLHFRYADAGWEEDLDPYLTDEFTDLEWYDLDDFYPTLITVNRWDLKIGGKVGEPGALYGLPAMVETYVFAYRGDLADKYGLEEPQTIEDLYNWAKTVQEGEWAEGNTNFYGGVTRGHPTSCPWTGYQGMQAAYAETTPADFRINKETCEFESTHNQPLLVDFTDKYVATMRDYGPPGWTSVLWYDGKELFATGNYGFYTDCDFFASTYEDPDVSAVAGKVRYSFLPHPEGEDPKTGIHTWSLGIHTSGKNKEPGWYFVQYMTGPEQLLRATVEFNNYNPTRKSVFEHPDLQAVMGEWGQGTYLPTVVENFQYASRWETIQTQGSAVGERLCVAMHEMWGEERDAQEALDEAAEDINEIMRKAGVKPDPSLCE
jgi:multiple sugar transport system substrate-binding protein